MDAVTFITSLGRSKSYGNQRGGSPRSPFRAGSGEAIVGLQRAAGFCRPLTGIETSSTSAETTLFHASPKVNCDSIKSRGLEGTDGRIGYGVYAVFTEGQARKIGDHHCGGRGNYDVWTFHVDQSSHRLHVEEHPPWCGLDTFKEVLIPESLTGPGMVQLA